MLHGLGWLILLMMSSTSWKDAIMKVLKNLPLCVLRGGCYTLFFCYYFSQCSLYENSWESFLSGPNTKDNFRNSSLHPHFYIVVFNSITDRFFFLYMPLQNLEILWPTGSKVLKFYCIHFNKLFIMETIFKHTPK